jgi:hypothetical protein
MSRHRRSVVAFATAMATAAVVVGVRAWHGPPDAELWFWLVACIASEALWLKLPQGRSTLSMASCINFAAILVLPLGHALAVTAVATLVAELALMRKPPIRAAFNASQTALAVAAAAGLLATLRSAGLASEQAPGVGDIGPFALCALVYYAVNRSSVVLMIALHERQTLKRVWMDNFGNGYELLSSGAVFSLGTLLGIHYAANGMGLTLLFVLPLVVAFEGYRRHLGPAKASAPEAPAQDDRRSAA